MRVSVQFNRPRSKPRIPVICVECGTKFGTTITLPTCPGCGGVHVEVR